MDNSFKTTMHHYNQRTENILAHYLDMFPNADSGLISAMKYSALSGGKRLRPVLVYTVGEMLGANLQRLDIAAAAIEYIHTYSLIHDDLPAMDDAPFRRGYPSCHVRYGEATAILAGDALQTLAFAIVSHSEILPINTRMKIIQELSAASGASGLCEGQAADLEAEGKQIDTHTLAYIYRKKTGLLMRSAIRIAAYTADRQSMLPILDSYADKLGLAFQIQDDILDIVGNPSNTGKARGNDAKHQKNTFPALLGLEQAQQKTYDLYLQAIEVLKKLKGYNIDPLMNLTNFIIERNK